MSIPDARATLITRNVDSSLLEELLAYLESPYRSGPVHDAAESAGDPTFWRRRQARALEIGSLAALEEVMPQLRFPIGNEQQRDPIYRAATLRGEPGGDFGGLGLEHATKLSWELHQAPIGPILAVYPHGRADFVRLVCALVGRNEPISVPDSMGACAVAGYNNWGRIAELRELFRNEQPGGDWPAEFARLRSTPQLFRERFLIISDGPYSGILGHTLGVAEDQWCDLSKSIRLHHELFHLFCRQVYGQMQTNALDEVLADYSGLVGATGRYRADWLLAFLGLESEAFRPGGRLSNYTTSLSPASFTVMCGIVRDAAYQLELLEPALQNLSLEKRQRFLLKFTLLELAQGKAKVARTGPGEGLSAADSS